MNSEFLLSLRAAQGEKGSSFTFEIAVCHGGALPAFECARNRTRGRSVPPTRSRFSLTGAPQVSPSHRRSESGTAHLDVGGVEVQRAQHRQLAALDVEREEVDVEQAGRVHHGLEGDARDAQARCQRGGDGVSA